MHPWSSIAGQISAQDRQRLAFYVSKNLKYHLSEGTVIEATSALETLPTNSDVDLNLPMSMAAPPYRARYLKFGEVATRYLKMPPPQSLDHCFDGVFCFLTRHVSSDDAGGKCWTLPLVFISKQQDSRGGHVPLLGEMDRGDITVGDWLAEILGNVKAADENEIHRSMHATVSYVFCVFLYIVLRQARVAPHGEYEEALRRAAGLEKRKRSKLLHRSALLYNGILVGPEALLWSASKGTAGSGVTPHRCREHFRMQPFGIGNQQRKLISVALVQVHAEQLQAMFRHRNRIGPVPQSLIRRDHATHCVYGN